MLQEGRYTHTFLSITTHYRHQNDATGRSLYVYLTLHYHHTLSPPEWFFKKVAIRILFFKSPHTITTRMMLQEGRYTYTFLSITTHYRHQNDSSGRSLYVYLMLHYHHQKRSSRNDRYYTHTKCYTLPPPKWCRRNVATGLPNITPHCQYQHATMITVLKMGSGAGHFNVRIGCCGHSHWYNCRMSPP